MRRARALTINTGIRWGSEIITNGGFENGYTGWTQSPDGRGIYYWAVPDYYNGGVADVLTVPYNINILEKDCGILPLDFSASVRPNAATKVRVE